MRKKDTNMSPAHHMYHRNLIYIKWLVIYLIRLFLLIWGVLLIY